jgi:hypothetical protein
MYTSEWCRNKTRADIFIPGGLLFMWGVVPSFRFRVSVAASQKNPISALRKWKKHISWDEKKIGLRGVPRHRKVHARVRCGFVLTNYAIIRAEPSSFDLKAMQPQMWQVISVKGLFGILLLSRFEFFPVSR